MTHKIRIKTTYVGHVLCSFSEFEVLDAGDAQMHKWFIQEIEIFEEALTELRAKILKDFENDA